MVATTSTRNAQRSKGGGKYVVIINLAWYARVIMMDKIPNGPNMIF